MHERDVYALSEGTNKDKERGSLHNEHSRLGSGDQKMAATTQTNEQV